MNYSCIQEQQLTDPANLILAHDTGLAHYWQAKKAENNEQAVAHWQKVIANWAMVLESDAYWQKWGAERGEIYGKSVEEEHINSARQALIERILLELAEIAQTDEAVADFHLEAAFRLERKAIRLLKRTKGLAIGLAITSEERERLDCGPMLARQLSLLPQVEDFFQHYPESGPDSLQIILAYIQKDEKQSAETDRAIVRKLRICFSQLGIAFIYLEREEPHRMLGLLAGLECPACESATVPSINKPAIISKLPTLCQDNCHYFKQLNPAYNFVSGRRLFYCHAAEIMAGAYLSLAYQSLISKPFDITKLLGFIQDALDISQVLGIHEALKTAIADIMLGWAGGLERNKSFDEAVLLVEAVRDFEKGDRWKVKLGSILNMRGVKRADEKHWEESVADLRRACELNPHAPLFRQNLENALHAYADEAYKAGNDSLARDLLNEAETQLEKPGPVPVQFPDEKTEAEPVAELVLTEAERVNPALFDQQGLLKLEVFDISGQAILDKAKQEAEAMGEMFLKPPALVLALAQFEGGETIRLLGLQGIAPDLIRNHVHASDSTYNGKQFKSTTVLSQFNLWFSVLRIFDLAWEIAQYDQNMIGEPHILYGLLVSRSGTKQLQAAGVDVNKMIEQAVWN